MLKKSLIIILVSFLMISCSTIKTTKKEKIKVSPKINFFPPWNLELNNLIIKTNLSISNKNQSYSASANIRIAKLDSISMKINGPFGISVGKLYATQHMFDFYNAITDQLIEGVPDADSFRQIIKMPISYNDLIRLMRCETPGNPMDFVFVKQLSDSTNENLFKNDKNPDYIEYAVISSTDLTLTQYQRKLRNGKMILHIFYNNYDKVNGINYSMKQLYKFPEINSSLILKINSININPVFQNSFKTIYPKDIKKIKLN